MKGLCSALAEADLGRLGSVSWHRRFHPGEAIHVEGEVPPSFCAIVSGVVKLLKSLPNGSQQIVGLFGAGDFLGRPFGGEARATAVAASEVEVCWFPRATIETVTASSGAVKDWLYEHVADELEKA
jgi:CRP/FNR family transcriptional regulator